MCPRCKRPNHPGIAASRTDSLTLVCEECVKAEEIQEWLDGAALAQSEWPVIY